MEDRLITVAIHTYEKALMLKSLLENEGISVTLQNVNLVQPVVSSGVRVRIHEKDLPLALKVIENSDIFCAPSEKVNTTDVKRPMVLVPVDYSLHSLNAAKMAFKLAAAHGATVTLLHVFTTVITGLSAPLNGPLTFLSEEGQQKEYQESDETATKMMDKFSMKIRQLITDGDIPAVKFNVTVTEGVPEEIINIIARREKPLFIVMGTRGTDRKDRDMIGSVTAEVLDTCRSTVITVPSEAVPDLSAPNLSTVYFGNMDQADMLALDTLYRIFNTITLKVTLVAVPCKKNATHPDSQAISAMLDYCRSHYPRFEFDSTTFDFTDNTKDLAATLKSLDASLLAMPNKKRNVFARFFNPTLPHRLFYDADLPMVVIPV